MDDNKTTNNNITKDTLVNKTFICPECQNEILIVDEVEPGDVYTCPKCGVDVRLEVGEEGRVNVTLIEVLK